MNIFEMRHDIVKIHSFGYLGLRSEVSGVTVMPQHQHDNQRFPGADLRPGANKKTRFRPGDTNRRDGDVKDKTVSKKEDCKTAVDRIIDPRVPPASCKHRSECMERQKCSRK